MTRYPDIEVELSGCDGNGFAIIGTVVAALRKAGVPKEEHDLFIEQATSGDYDHLLQTAMEWVNVT